MNDFTRKDLKIILNAVTHWLGVNSGDIIKNKIQSMIDNYSVFNKKKIAQSHLKEAASLIDHAMHLLEMERDD